MDDSLMGGRAVITFCKCASGSSVTPRTEKMQEGYMQPPTAAE